MRLMINRLGIAFAFLLAFSPVAIARPLVYEDGFVWYLSHRLAAQTGQALGFSKLASGDRHQYLFELALTYHHKLIACDGPLEALHKRFSYDADELTPKPDSYGILAYVGDIDDEIIEAVSPWNAMVRDDVIRILKTSSASTAFPACMVKGYQVPEIAR